MSKSSFRALRIQAMLLKQLTACKKKRLTKRKPIYQGSGQYGKK